MTIRPATPVRNAMLDAVKTQVDLGSGAGLMRIYSGAQPANGDAAAPSGLLAEVVLGDPSFAVASAGSMAAADPPAVTGTAAGTAASFRVFESGGTVAKFDGSVTATGGGGDLQLSTTTISIGVSVDITSFSLSAPA